MRQIHLTTIRYRSFQPTVLKVNIRVQDRPFSCRHVQAVAGLSARQQNDWDERGALPHERVGNEGWRRFSLEEVLTLAVCAELRRKFGVPVERLKPLQRFFLNGSADTFRIERPNKRDRSVATWLVTDLDRDFAIESDARSARFESGAVRRPEGDGVWLVANLTNLVERGLLVLGRSSES
jgi:DNA-binding transcriptional MerR regulator